MRTTTHLMQKRGVYYARFRVPARLRPWLDQTEIRWPLRTCHLKTARHRLHVVSLIHADMLRAMLNLTPQNPTVTALDEDAVSLAHAPLTDSEKAVIKAHINAIKLERLAEFKRLLGDGDAGPLDGRDFLKQEHAWISSLQAAIDMDAFDTPEVINPASLLLDAVERLRHDFSGNNPNLRYLARQFCASMLAVNTEMQTLLANPRAPIEPESTATTPTTDSIEPISATVPEPMPTTTPTPDLGKTPPEIKVSKLVDMYLRDKREKKLRPKTIATYQAEFQRFVDFTGDVACRDIDRELMRSFRSALLRYPSGKQVALLKKSFHERLLPEPSDATISSQTVSKYIERIGQLLDWGRLEGLPIATDLAKNLGIPDRRRERDVRDRFSDDDITRFFSEPDFQGKAPFAKAAFYWVPLISLYSGARLNEVCQLHLCDIGIEGGIPFFDINDQNGKTLKPGQATQRRTPIHSKLIELGFLDYTEDLRRAGHTVVFPTLNAHPLNGLGHGVSSWFSRRKKKLGFGPKLVFHSLRHTTTDETLQTSQNEMMTNAVVGHTGNATMSSRRYGKDMSLVALQTIIEAIQFPVPAVPFSKVLLDKAERAALTSPARADALKSKRLEDARKARTSE